MIVYDIVKESPFYTGFFVGRIISLSENKMNIIGFLALIGMFLPLTTSALAEEAQPRLDQPDYFTQERYLELTGHAVASVDVTETTGDDAFLSSNSSPAPKTTTGFAGARRVLITAYSSSADQTDSTPFIMANGKHVYDGAVAANFLPFGALVRIPRLFGNKIFVVEDRMHERFNDRLDIWMPTRGEALAFGLRSATIEVIY